MNNVEKIFRNEIEVERMRAVTEQGIIIFLTGLVFSTVLVFVLWDYVSHSSILLWFIALNVLNLVRWGGLQIYKKHFNALNPASVPRVKLILIIGAVVHGLCWGMANLLFIDPAQPYTLLIMSVAIYCVSVGAMLHCFSYLPAVMAFMIPASGLLIVPLLMHGHKGSVGLGLVLTATAILGISGCVRVGRIYIFALRLNFENVALHRESEEKSLLLETALENMGHGISMSDKADRLRMWNRQFTDLLGPAGDKVATDINLESVLNAADPPLKAQADSGTEHRLKNGRVFEIRQTELEQGGRVLTYTDISDLIEREQALKAARKAAEQANAAKTRFLAAASHDLRQPIHALGLFFTELSDRVRGSETDSLIAQVEDSISAINSMLNALLDISKLDAGVVKPSIEPFALTGLFARLESEFQPVSLENDNQLQIRPTQAIVQTDPVMLERMLRNLIANALRYTENGRVLVAARPLGDTVRIEVLDTGPGIPEDQLDEIFIEFHQLGNPARDRRQGLGLGLAIVKRLGILLQHEIKVVSHLGRGSRFSTIVPRSGSPVSDPGVRIFNRATPGNSLKERRVLVLDDEIAILEGMRGLLTRWGCEVITACSKTQALEQLDANPKKPELLIVDYRLPDTVLGIDVAKDLQNHLQYPAPVLIITGDTGPERLREADASGYPLLHKPVQPAKLRSTLEYLVSEDYLEIDRDANYPVRARTI